jgi:hypothetical protein
MVDLDWSLRDWMGLGMRLISIDAFDDEVMPTEATFRLTLDEMALLNCLTGCLSSVDVARATGSGRWYEAASGVYDSTSTVVNHFWENGVHDIAPSGITVDSLYEAKRSRMGER